MYLNYRALRKKPQTTEGGNVMKIYLTFTNFSLTPPEKMFSFHNMNKTHSFKIRWEFPTAISP